MSDRGSVVVDDLKKGYYLLFIDGGKRASQQGQAEGAIGVILQEPDCGSVLASVSTLLRRRALSQCHKSEQVPSRCHLS